MFDRTILYVFRRPVNKTLKNITDKTAPADVVYGFTEISKKIKSHTTDKVFNSRIILSLQYLFDQIVTKNINIGFSIFPSLMLLPELRRSDLIFATVDTYGLPIMFLKKLKLFKTPVVINTMGLYDGLIRKKNRLITIFFRKILMNTNHFISGGSFQECEKLANLLKIPVKKFTFIPFGIDTDFFTSKKIPEKNEILIIGADPYRDWLLYQKIALKLPSEKFRIITFKGLVKYKMPANVIFEYDLSYSALRDRIWQAKFILLLTKLNHYLSGQSTAFRCMSCGKSVIITNTPGFDEYLFKNNLHYKTVPIGDDKAVLSAINYLNNSETIRRKMGMNAQALIRKRYNLNLYSRKLYQIFLSVLDKNHI